jgi:hypothetical protein
MTPNIYKSTLFAGISIAFTACNAQDMKVEDMKVENRAAYDRETVVQTAVGPWTLPSPYAEPSKTNNSKIIKWPEGRTPMPLEGFKVTRFADGFDHPRWLYVGPNGDLFVAESKTRNSANRITLLRDTNGDGTYDLRRPFAEKLNSPLGMLALRGYFYIANTDGLCRWPYEAGDDSLEGKGEKILDLPTGGYNHHWTRNIIADTNGDKIYVSVGSASNVGEYGLDEEKRRACILQINPDGSGEKLFAHGLRNPVGLAWNPVTGALWTAVNERDKLGDNLVPDYITSVVEGGFYGWPFSYFGQVKDPRWSKDPHDDLVNKAMVPDVPLGNHTASLGLVFYTGSAFPERYLNGAFVAQHGSWNRSELSGYKVVFVPFEDGKPRPPVDFLTGFVAGGDGSQVHGRPVGMAQLPDGSLLVVDDGADILWRVSAE